jgi:hypothetical protein
MRRQPIASTPSGRLLRVAVVLGVAAALAVLVAAPASAGTERKAGRYAFVIGFGTEPAYAGAPNSLQVVISRDGRPATDLAGRLDTLKAHLYLGGKVDPGAEMVELALAPHFGEGWGTPGDYRSFFVPTRAGSYTVHLNGRLGAQTVDLAVPSGPGTFGDVNDPAKAAFPAVEAPGAAQQAAKDTADQALLVALGGLIVGAVGLVVAGLAWGRQAATPAAGPDVALTGAGKA